MRNNTNLDFSIQQTGRSKVMEEESINDASSVVTAVLDALLMDIREHKGDMINIRQINIKSLDQSTSCEDTKNQESNLNNSCNIQDDITNTRQKNDLLNALNLTEMVKTCYPCSPEQKEKKYSVQFNSPLTVLYEYPATSQLTEDDTQSLDNTSDDENSLTTGDEKQNASDQDLFETQKDFQKVDVYLSDQFTSTEPLTNDQITREGEETPNCEVTEENSTIKSAADQSLGMVLFIKETSKENNVKCSSHFNIPCLTINDLPCMLNEVEDLRTGNSEVSGNLEEVKNSQDLFDNDSDVDLKLIEKQLAAFDLAITKHDHLDDQGEQRQTNQRDLYEKELINGNEKENTTSNMVHTRFKDPVLNSSCEQDDTNNCSEDRFDEVSDAKLKIMEKKHTATDVKITKLENLIKNNNFSGKEETTHLSTDLYDEESKAELNSMVEQHTPNESVVLNSPSEQDETNNCSEDLFEEVSDTNLKIMEKKHTAIDLKITKHENLNMKHPCEQDETNCCSEELLVKDSKMELEIAKKQLNANDIQFTKLENLNKNDHLIGQDETNHFSPDLCTGELKAELNRMVEQHTHNESVVLREENMYPNDKPSEQNEKNDCLLDRCMFDKESKAVTYDVVVTEIEKMNPPVEQHEAKCIKNETKTQEQGNNSEKTMLTTKHIVNNTGFNDCNSVGRYNVHHETGLAMNDIDNALSDSNSSKKHCLSPASSQKKESCKRSKCEETSSPNEKELSTLKRKQLDDLAITSGTNKRQKVPDTYENTERGTYTIDKHTPKEENIALDKSDNVLDKFDSIKVANGNNTLSTDDIYQGKENLSDDNENISDEYLPTKENTEKVKKEINQCTESCHEICLELEEGNAQDSKLLNEVVAVPMFENYKNTDSLSHDVPCIQLNDGAVENLSLGKSVKDRSEADTKIVLKDESANLDDTEYELFEKYSMAKWTQTAGNMSGLEIDKNITQSNLQQEDSQCEVIESCDLDDVKLERSNLSQIVPTTIVSMEIAAETEVQSTKQSTRISQSLESYAVDGNSKGTFETDPSDESEPIGIKNATEVQTMPILCKVISQVGENQEERINVNEVIVPVPDNQGEAILLLECGFISASQVLSQSSENSGSTGFVVNASGLSQNDSSQSSLEYVAVEKASEENGLVKGCLIESSVEGVYIEAPVRESRKQDCLIESSVEGVYIEAPVSESRKQDAEEGEETIKPGDGAEKGEKDHDIGQLDHYIDQAVDQLVPDDHVTPEAVGTDIDEEHSIYSSSCVEKKVKVYACDADICDDADQPLCSPLEQTVKPPKTQEGCFNWKYTLSCDMSPDTAPVPPLPNEDNMLQVPPFKTCAKPLRVGLSRRQPVNSLHKLNIKRVYP